MYGWGYGDGVGCNTHDIGIGIIYIRSQKYMHTQGDMADTGSTLHGEIVESCGCILIEEGFTVVDIWQAVRIDTIVDIVILISNEEM